MTEPLILNDNTLSWQVEAPQTKHARTKLGPSRKSFRNEPNPDGRGPPAEAGNESPYVMLFSRLHPHSHAQPHWRLIHQSHWCLLPDVLGPLLPGKSFIDSQLHTHHTRSPDSDHSLISLCLVQSFSRSTGAITVNSACG